ncbi:Mismatch repair protein msh3 [Zalaria obscura]|uniref:Mismatch repair protein msh3 n=1 Tax=Zalaria obscura TaxID=2024903 RepID=A0ACC3SK95_9PEZI
MAPSHSPSMSQSSQKKQQSISSFFTAKPATKPAVASPPQKAPEEATNGNGAVNTDNDLFVDDDEEPIVPNRRGSQRPKRTVDDEDNADDLPSAKRLRRTIEDTENEAPDGDSATIPRRRSSAKGAPPDESTSNHRPRVTDRTSKYMFPSSGVAEQEADISDDEETRRYKERMHQKFVKRLGRPDSIAEIKRRNHFISEETEAAEAEADEEIEEEETPKPTKGRKGVGAKKGGSKLTPMERQVIDIKRQHMDTLLVVEVGYKYRFFGEDARIAAKELGIVCIPGKFRYDEHPSEAHLDRFASASFPTHRLHVHVKRLVAAGNKVGVVRQLETAALKAAGDNRNAPFVRKLTNLYTKGTYIDEEESRAGPALGSSGGASSSGHLLCLTETNAKGWGTDEKVRFGIIAVQPTTGDIIYDDFEDGFMRSELETRLLHIAPCEFLLVGPVSKATEKVIQHLSGSKTNVFGDRARVERVDKPKTMAAQAYSHISNFYAGKMNSAESSEQHTALLDKVHTLSEHVTICLSAMITHLTDYGLEHVFDLTKYFQSFSARSHMLLNGNTLTSLEIYQNQTDHTDNGSLFWTLDRTQTRFGQRLLRKWVGRPLLDKSKLDERVNAVEELLSSERTVGADRLNSLLRQIKGDLEKSLIRIYYKKCGRAELLGVLQTLQTIANEYAHVKSPADAGFTSTLISESIASLPQISEEVISYLERINLEAAKKDDKYNFFRDEYETETITDHKVGIVSIEHDLNEHRKEAAAKLRKSKVDYVTVAGIEYLIEVDNGQIKNVPASWAKISGTKAKSRFHTPEVVRFIRERDQHKEALAAACDAAFADLLTEIGSKYQAFRDCVQSLATLDCLLSLAEIARQPGYCKPVFLEGDEVSINVEQGRHPMVEQLLLDAYVSNDVHLASSQRALLITGPNMGGKSSYVRSVALIAIMAQIGSYVPAASARLSLLDAVFTRMGAFDNMMKGESTFMVELSETSDILKQASPRSLVILDELGRGTSTHDGVAIAQAVLDYVIRETRCLTLFITHYQALARMEAEWKGELSNVHMRFTEQGEGNGDSKITFLYEVGEGVAHRSYGLNVAMLAGLPKGVIDLAAVKSRDMEGEEAKRRLGYISRMMGQALSGGDGLDAVAAGIERL